MKNFICLLLGLGIGAIGLENILLFVYGLQLSLIVNRTHIHSLYHDRKPSLPSFKDNILRPCNKDSLEAKGLHLIQTMWG